MRISFRTLSSGQSKNDTIFVTVATVSINQTVGDWVVIKNAWPQAIEQAKTDGAKLVVLPEMCIITGYSLGDRLLMPGTLRRAKWAHWNC